MSKEVKFNPLWSEQRVSDFQKKVIENGGYCPCALVKTEDTICPCKELRENGYCCCHLYEAYETNT